MKNTKIVMSIFLASLLTACAHYPDVRPSANGEHYIMLTAATKSDMAKEAISQANAYCGEQDKRAYILNEIIEYKGSIPEEEFLTKRNIATAVKSVGSTMWVLGENKVDDAGSALAIGGGIVEDSLGQPYELNMSFTCR